MPRLCGEFGQFFHLSRERERCAEIVSCAVLLLEYHLQIVGSRSLSRFYEDERVYHSQRGHCIWFERYQNHRVPALHRFRIYGPPLG